MLFLGKISELPFCGVTSRLYHVAQEPACFGCFIEQLYMHYMTTEIVPRKSFQYDSFRSRTPNRSSAETAVLLYFRSRSFLYAVIRDIFDLRFDRKCRVVDAVNKLSVVLNIGVKAGGPRFYDDGAKIKTYDLKLVDQYLGKQTDLDALWKKVDLN